MSSSTSWQRCGRERVSVFVNFDAPLQSIGVDLGPIATSRLDLHLEVLISHARVHALVEQGVGAIEYVVVHHVGGLGEDRGTGDQVDFDDFETCHHKRVSVERQEELIVFARGNAEAGFWDLEC